MRLGAKGFSYGRVLRGSCGHGVDEDPVQSLRTLVARLAESRQLVGFAPQRLAFVRGRRIRGEPFVNPDDQARVGSQPRELLVAEHQLQPLAARGDATVFAFEARTFGVEQRFMKIQQAIADLTKTKRRDGHELSRTPRSSLRHARRIARLDEARTVEAALGVGVDDEIDGAAITLQ